MTTESSVLDRLTRALRTAGAEGGVHRRGRLGTMPAVKPHRAFDPHVVGRLECEAWVTYYRHEWFAFLRVAVRLTRHTFGLSWPATIYGSWLVLRALQLWAPLRDNDPDGARRSMERFYRLLARGHTEPFDPATAAQLDIEWWRVHREHQYAEAGGDDTALVEALVKLYSYVYGVPEETVRAAAEQRAVAMRLSDQWLREGGDLRSPLIDQERTALVRSYAGLLASVHQL